MCVTYSKSNQCDLLIIFIDRLHGLAFSSFVSSMARRDLRNHEDLRETEHISPAVASYMQGINY